MIIHSCIPCWSSISRFCRFSSSFASITRSSLIDVLRNRGLIQQTSQPEKKLSEKLLNGDGVKIYCGFDPTGCSLHLGNLVPLMILLHFYVRGHEIVPVVGGATGKVGDPSGRKSARSSISDSSLLNNVDKISKQLTKFFENGRKYYCNRISEMDRVAAPGCITVRNNYEWLKDVKLLDFLAVYGKHIRVGTMLRRDSVSSRLASPEGLGFNEFTYQLLQAYDFYHLYKEHGVSVQVGGSDQWGNITSGIDLISKISSSSDTPAFGITAPLLTTSTGEKFGKSAGNAVFIDPDITTSFDIYQFFLNTTDDDLSKLLKIFTMLPLETINQILSDHNKNPEFRIGQRTLAVEAVDLIHGIGLGQEAQAVSDILYGKAGVPHNARNLIRIFGNAKILNTAPRSVSLVQLICDLTSCSKAEARRKINQGSIYLGPLKKKIKQTEEDLKPHLIDNEVLILRIGKQNCFVICLN